VFQVRLQKTTSTVSIEIHKGAIFDHLTLILRCRKHYFNELYFSSDWIYLPVENENIVTINEAMWKAPGCLFLST
jgi:hypothetical protein